MKLARIRKSHFSFIFSLQNPKQKNQVKSNSSVEHKNQSWIEIDFESNCCENDCEIFGRN